jgi:hypothetical protein
MLSWPSFWVRPQEMMKHVQECDDMLFVAARLARANVIDNHVANFLWAVFLVTQVFS